MTAIHLTTVGPDRDWSNRAIAGTLRRITGVAKVAAVASVGLVSVLFDETRSSAEQILRTIRAAGLDATVYESGHALEPSDGEAATGPSA